MSSVAQKLAAAFMPGVLTLLLPTRENIKWAGDDTVALRIPKHQQARRLLGRGTIGESLWNIESGDCLACYGRFC